MEGDNSVTIQKQKFGFFAIEMFKVINFISVPIIIELFSWKEVNRFDLRNSSDFILPTVKIVFSRLET